MFLIFQNNILIANKFDLAYFNSAPQFEWNAYFKQKSIDLFDYKFL